MTRWTRRVFFLLMLLPIAACQAESEKYQAGVHYEILPQAVRTANPDKIEVNEIFSYACGHCYNFEKTLGPWKQKLADDVDFQRTPAVWQPVLEPFAKAYYSAAVLNVLDEAHIQIFDGYHLSKELAIRKGYTPGEKEFAKVFVAQGITAEKFSSVYNSFGMNSMVNQAKSRIRGYRTQGTPELVVNGKYRITVGQTKSFEGMLSVADYLVEKERQAQANQ